MATNLRLRPDEEAALKAESERTGLSQQAILRRAIDEYLGLAPKPRAKKLPDWVIPATEPYRRIEPSLVLPDGVTTLDLLDREDRL
ncbi:hypothetical protein LK09_00045 [Microbacterium mangrovi]|uniref:Ribbon-helix-helix protein CopG domain-containing protein n=1 Tax=Microbacterium mangrovi TaxID=1348253 RepID=A0A0B2A883_9MICO|nr:ribbon-helix-helix protein, CopG family [Microbacterium mangrovi]KHK99788.1 hypothetical protein LK09_00045 [Microbacterium mangrovi]